MGAEAVSESADPVALLEIRDGPLSVDEVLTAVSLPAAGGIAVFAGAVRNSDQGRAVARLEYAAHPSATAVLQAVAHRVLGEHPAVLRLAAVHRVGVLAIGDLAVVVGVACQHRGPAFEACRALIDALKGEVPIWKHQLFSDGTQQWVGSL